MKNQIHAAEAIITDLIPPRFFTYEQVKQLSDENFKVLNRCVIPSRLKKNEIYYLTPFIVHHHAFDEPFIRHLRVSVINLSDNEQVGIQDVTFEQWERGLEIKL